MARRDLGSRKVRRERLDGGQLAKDTRRLYARDSATRRRVGSIAQPRRSFQPGVCAREPDARRDGGRVTRGQAGHSRWFHCGDSSSVHEGGRWFWRQGHAARKQMNCREGVRVVPGDHLSGDERTWKSVIVCRV